MKKIFRFLFIAVSVENIGALIFDWPVMFMITKPLIVISLMAFYIADTKSISYKFISALMFALAGDAFLLFTEKGEQFFMLGLLSFLISHVFYILAYAQHQQPGMSEGLLSTQKIRFALPIVLFGTGLIVILTPHLGGLKFPVMIYAVVLMVMALVALSRSGKTTRASFWLVFIGAILFMISDSVLAINKFLISFQSASVVIMITYISAQLLIVLGIIRHAKI